MSYSLRFTSYQRPFRQPLKTAHGIWKVREGIIITLANNQGKIGRGEIAPLPEFCSETLAQAWEFCTQMGKTGLGEEIIFSIPSHLPACQFAFESAWEDLYSSISLPDSLTYSHLLPTGKAALRAWKEGWEAGERTFKWKIGVDSTQEEIATFKQLLEAFPSEGKLRLDANGGLSLPSAREWLRVTDSLPQIEFIEQPLPPSQLLEMLQLSEEFTTPLALDESVATLAQLKRCYEKGWRGIYIIKGAISGSPQRLRQFCQENPLDVVFSSVFETAVGRKAVLNLASELSSPHRAVGFGVNHWFNE